MAGNGIQCPYCGAQDSSVLESRTVFRGAAIRRRRECFSCGERFTTHELHLPEISKGGASPPQIQAALEKHQYVVAQLQSLRSQVETLIVEMRAGHDA